MSWALVKDNSYFLGFFKEGVGLLPSGSEIAGLGKVQLDPLGAPGAVVLKMVVDDLRGHAFDLAVCDLPRTARWHEEHAHDRRLMALDCKGYVVEGLVLIIDEIHGQFRDLAWWLGEDHATGEGQRGQGDETPAD